MQSQSIEAFQNLSRQLLDRFSIYRETFCLLDSSLIAVQSIKLSLLLIALDSTSTAKSVEISARQILDSSRSIELHFSIYSLCAIFFSFLFDFTRQKHSFLSFKHFSLNLFTFPTCFSAQSLFSSSGMVSFLSFYHAFHSFRLRFLGFFKIDEFFVNFLGWVMSCIASHLHFHHVSCIQMCVLNVEILCAGRFGLG